MGNKVLGNTAGCIEEEEQARYDLGKFNITTT